ncbi:MAG: hypothetical protein KDD53_09705, partial [Bdellovibrionales bacterium]|nr:hypothetical protein [Bdellovibrionales bacterium]
MRDSTGAKITLVGVLAAGAAIGSWAAMAEESPPSIDLLAVQGPCYDVLSESQFPLMPSPGLMTAMPGPEVQPSALGVVVSEDEPVAEFARVEDELCDLLGTICQTYLTDEPDFDRLSWLVKSVADGSVVDDASVLTDSFGNISGKLDTGSSSIKARFSISAEGDYRILINPPAIDGFIST